ncbi:MAG TPA: non-canonical purine NTP pyrophosphatase, partial [Verrucomicrobiae bacterium]|nr:non-canonical purine NTP pyrophosphatase [Verrucomicrobiae bacterium]
MPPAAMLTLVTSNTSKYQPFQPELERMRITLEKPKREMPELQSLSFAEALQAKTRVMAEAFGRPVLVDDAGVVLEAYKPFPGPLTSVVLRSLGQTGLARLLNGVSDRATMECHIGCWLNGRLRSWTGRVPGRIDASRRVKNERMPLTDMFVPEAPAGDGVLLHRVQALAELEKDAFELHLELGPEFPSEAAGCASPASFQCPFCLELEGDTPSVFTEMLGERLLSRIVYEDEDFVVMPPLGEFMAGGLLLMTRTHIPSFAQLPGHLFGKLERLIAAVCRELTARWGVSPLVFEHGPAAERTKGQCCVDHAHFNIFPARVQVRPHLSSRMGLGIGDLQELRRLGRAEF